MGALDDARAHVAKAQEFLAAAEFTLDLDLFNAAASSAVSSGINSKDAICLRLTGVSRKTDNHAQAVAELAQSGGVGTALTQTFSRLLSTPNTRPRQSRPQIREGRAMGDADAPSGHRRSSILSSSRRTPPAVLSADTVGRTTIYRT